MDPCQLFNNTQLLLISRFLWDLQYLSAFNVNVYERFYLLEVTIFCNYLYSCNFALFSLKQGPQIV